MVGVVYLSRPIELSDAAAPTRPGARPEPLEGLIEPPKGRGGGQATGECVKTSSGFVRRDLFAHGPDLADHERRWPIMSSAARSSAANVRRSKRILFNSPPNGCSWVRRLELYQFRGIDFTHQSQQLVWLGTDQTNLPFRPSGASLSGSSWQRGTTVLVSVEWPPALAGAADRTRVGEDDRSERAGARERIESSQRAALLAAASPRQGDNEMMRAADQARLRSV